MTSRELIRWSRLHERRARRRPAFAVPVLVGVVLAGWVWWRASAGPLAGSHAWLAGAVVGYGVAFLRVPFHIYWRADAPLLAQLPIEGGALFDAALVRSLWAAGATTIAAVLGAAPLALGPDGAMTLVRHAGCALALGCAAGLLLPAVTIGAAALVVEGGAATALRAATALGGAPARSSPGKPPAQAAGPPSSPSAILGALPGFAAAVVLVAVLLLAPWLTDGAASPAPAVLAAIAGLSVLAAAAARRGAGIMALVLRDVSALDRQRLATLDIRPPTSLEAAIARLLGDAALPYGKDARLMRRRFPMAFALGAMVFGVLALVGVVRPDDPTPWLMVAIGGAAAYGLVLAARLGRPPIELARLSATLPLGARASARAKLAWLLGWWTVFAAAPAVFAALRQDDPAIGLGLTAAATIAIIVAGALPR